MMDVCLPRLHSSLTPTHYTHLRTYIPLSLRDLLSYLVSRSGTPIYFLPPSLLVGSQLCSRTGYLSDQPPHAQGYHCRPIYVYMYT